MSDGMTDGYRMMEEVKKELKGARKERDKIADLIVDRVEGMQDSRTEGEWESGDVKWKWWAPREDGGLQHQGLQHQGLQRQGWKKGLGKEDPVVEEEGGGRHTATGYRLDLLPPEAVLRVGAILKMGIDKGYEENNWRKLSAKSHVNHALGHIMAWLMREHERVFSGEEGGDHDDHLANAACRILFAMETK